MSTKYAEHEKMRAINEKSQAIGAFLEWLEEEGIGLSKVDDWGNLVTHYESVNKLLARHFNIDLDKISKEKDQMVDELRKMNEGSCEKV